MNISKSQLFRLLKIDETVTRGECPHPGTLAGELEVSEKTILRDIEYLRNIGAPLAYDRKAKGYRYTEKNWFFPVMKLTEGELFALVAARAWSGAKSR